MFHLYLTLVYIIPNIYVFFRIKHLFISKDYRYWYIIVYLLLAAIFPFTQAYAHHDMHLLLKILSGISGYLLPFYLYLFLFVLLYDLFLLLNLLVKIIAVQKRKSFLFRLYTLSTMIFLSVAIVIAGIFNLNTIRVSKYEIEVPRKNSTIDHLRIAFVADIHIQQNTRLRFIEQFVRKVNATHPDLMLFGGDITEGNWESKNLITIESTLRKIQTKYGSYGILGNHEFYGKQEKGTFFKKAGIILLRDTMVRIDNSFYLGGRYDQHFKQRKTLNEFLKNFSPDLPSILMDHRPTQLHEVSYSPIDVQFSGHTHNGQLFPINLIIHHIYELSWGYRKIRNTQFFVTSGLRLWGPPVKTAGKSEIMLVDVNFN